MPRRGAVAIPLLILSIAACSSTASHSVISTGPDGLRTFTVITGHDGDPVVCPAFGLVDPVTGTLRGDPAGEPERLWLEEADGRHLSVVWPGGFTLRFDPGATLVDDHGKVVGRAGETVTLDQVRPGDHAGTFADPYIASGILFGGCYPFMP